MAPIDRLPKWLLSIPLVAHWLLLSLRYRSITLPTNVNPDIFSGGLVGESKMSYLERIGAEFAPWVARAIGAAPGAELERARLEAGLVFPLVAKPDIGWCGYGVRRIEDADALRAYAESMAHTGVVLQELIDAPGEAGLQYIRAADAPRGVVVAMTVRHHPRVVGDGRRSVENLIRHDTRAARKLPFYLACLGPRAAARVPARGETVRLTLVAAARAGALYEDATPAITQTLSDRIDAIARSMGEFHFGRFDVRFADRAALQAGRFKIIEINGAGSEAIQYWDPKYSMAASFRGVFANHRRLFELAAALRRRGYAPISLGALGAAHFGQQRLIRTYPPSS